MHVRVFCSRPTAVNLSDAAQKLSVVADKAASAPGADASSVVETVVAKCETMLEEDVQANKVSPVPLKSNQLQLMCFCIISKLLQSNQAHTGCHDPALQAIGKHGLEGIQKALQARNQQKAKLRILTHCNTGSLATAEYGTALGVIRATAEGGKLEHAYCTETRPYNQGLCPAGCACSYLVHCSIAQPNSNTRPMSVAPLHSQ